jgi:hypothetical protein
MASIFAASGTIVSMTANTTPPATFNAAGYAALTYVDLGCASNLGEFGDESSEVTFDCINTGRTLKIKGQRNAGNMTLTLALDDTTDGFDNVQAAESDDSTGDYYFKIEFPNKLNATGTNAIRYFGGKVMSAREVVGGANDVVTINLVISINTPIVKIAATAGA